jgi:ABC-type multidrug transport system permease subunit
MMTTVWGEVLPESGKGKSQDSLMYTLAAAAGLFTGWVDIRVGDLLFTALLVAAFCMLLGILRPHRPWRWVAIIGICVPLAVVLGYLVLTERPDRAQVWESFLAFFPGIAGAYGGALLRQAIGNILSNS